MPSFSSLHHALCHEKAARFVRVGLAMCMSNSQFPFVHSPHLPTTRTRPLAVHACQSRCRRYYQLSKIRQIHWKSVPKTLRCNDTTLQVILGDFSWETRSNRCFEKVLVTCRLLSLLILIFRCSLASLRLSRTPSSQQSTLGKIVVMLPIPLLLQQKKRWTGMLHGIIQNNSGSPFMSTAPSGNDHIS